MTSFVTDFSSPPGSGRSAEISATCSALDLLEGGDMATSFSVITTLPAETRPADQATYTVSAIDPPRSVEVKPEFDS